MMMSVSRKRYSPSTIPKCFFSLAEAAESAEKDEIEYLHQNRRKICSDETTHPTGKVVKNIYAEGVENLP